MGAEALGVKASALPVCLPPYLMSIYNVQSFMIMPSVPGLLPAHPAQERGGYRVLALPVCLALP